MGSDELGNYIKPEPSWIYEKQELPELENGSYMIFKHGEPNVPFIFYYKGITGYPINLVRGNYTVRVRDMETAHIRSYNFAYDDIANNWMVVFNYDRYPEEEL